MVISATRSFFVVPPTALLTLVLVLCLLLLCSYFVVVLVVLPVFARRGEVPFLRQSKHFFFITEGLPASQMDEFNL